MEEQILSDDIVSQLRDGIKELVSTARKEASGGEQLAGLESGLRRLFHQVGAQLLSRMTEAVGEQVEAGPRHCAECGEKERNVKRAPLTVMTTFGPMQVRRRHYYCRSCRRSDYPLDEHFGWGRHRMTMLGQEMVCLLTQALPYEKAVLALSRVTGMELSVEWAREVTRRNGERLLRRREEQVARMWEEDGEVEEEAWTPTLLVSADGCMVLESGEGVGRRRGERERERSRRSGEGSSGERGMEAKVGMVGWLVREGEGEMRVERASYVTSMGDAEEFADVLYWEASRRGGLGAREVVVLGDGAPWIWQRVATLFERRIEVLDWYHVREHMEEASQVLYGEQEGRRRRWRERRLERLWRGEVDGVVKELRREMGRRGERTKAWECLRRLAGYLERNRSRMDYPRYRRMGLPVGSGCIESACGVLVGGRLKRNGMQWRRHSAAPVLHLRAEFHSHRWDEAWTYLRQAA